MSGTAANKMPPACPGLKGIKFRLATALSEADIVYCTIIRMRV